MSSVPERLFTSADRKALGERLAPVYANIFRHALGPDYSLVTQHMTLDELSALVHVVLSERDDKERSAAVEVFQAAVKRIVAEHAPPSATPGAEQSDEAQRKARPKPSRLAKWEASWQAEQSDEALS